MKKRIFAIITVLALCASLLVLCSCGDKKSDPENAVFVTVSSEGELVKMHEAIEPTDVDGDGVISVCDAIAAVHEKDAFVAESTEYGLSIVKLWGVENGGSYGVYINNEMSYDLTAPVKAGDHIYAYSYKDLTNWTDAFSFFDKATASGKEVTLTLQNVAFDENWNPVNAPCAGAVITIDGAKTEFVTGEDGTVTITLEKGEHVISAVSDTLTLVPPVCIVAA